MMTDADMKQREKIVKSMKKNFADFRKRYGKRAKDVMYATATKMAMKETQTENYVHVRTYDNSHDAYINAGVKAHKGQTHALSDKGVVFKFDSKDNAQKFKHHINKNKKIYADDVNEANNLQGSSVKNIPYDELDMNDVAHNSSAKIAEDDGPHVSKLTNMDSPNFTTVGDPVAAVNTQSKLGNTDSKQTTAKRMTGKPFKSLRKRTSYGVEDLTGAVSGVAIGEAVKTEADKGEYDYEGDMAKSQLRSILYNAKMMHDMLEDNTNLPEWVQSKITLAQDYIVTAAQYMQSEMSEAVITPKPTTAKKVAPKPPVKPAQPVAAKKVAPKPAVKPVRPTGAFHKEEKQETPKIKYKKLRSKERFDARTKDVDQNYLYRSDN